MAYRVNSGGLTKLMGVSRKTVNELCTNKRSVTAETALMLARVFGNFPDFWLNTQQRNDIWKCAPYKTPGREDSKGQAFTGKSQTCRLEPIVIRQLFNSEE